MIEVLVTTILDSKPIVQAFEKIPAPKSDRSDAD